MSNFLDDPGLDKFEKSPEKKPIGEIKPVLEGKTKKVPMLDGQKMMDKKFLHASKPWKPMGRK